MQKLVFLVLPIIGNFLLALYNSYCLTQTNSRITNIEAKFNANNVIEMESEKPSQSIAGMEIVDQGNPLRMEKTNLNQKTKLPEDNGSMREDKDSSSEYPLDEKKSLAADFEGKVSLPASPEIVDIESAIYNGLMLVETADTQIDLVECRGNMCKASITTFNEYNNEQIIDAVMRTVNVDHQFEYRLRDKGIDIYLKF